MKYIKRLPAAVGAWGFALTVAPIAHAQIYDGRGGFWHGGMGWGHLVFGSILMLLFWGLIIALVVILLRWALGIGSTLRGPDRPTPLDILEERFAKGEIEREEFEERKKLLTK